MKKNVKIPVMKKVIVILIAGFVALLLGLHYIMSNMGLNNAEKVSEQTIGYAKEKLETYNNYTSNDRTKSLVRLLDKVSAFTEILKQETDVDATLEAYVKEQRMQGIIVLDRFIAE